MKQSRHFRIILGRIAHASMGPLTRSFCGRDLRGHPERIKLTCREAFKQCECRVCRKSMRPEGG